MSTLPGKFFSVTSIILNISSMYRRQETYEMTRDCAGAVYRGYEHRRDAVHAYSAARQADLLRNI